VNTAGEKVCQSSLPTKPQALERHLSGRVVSQGKHVPGLPARFSYNKGVASGPSLHQHFQQNKDRSTSTNGEAMKKFILTALAVAGLSLAKLSAAESAKLNVGDPAPAFKAGKWFKGQPVEKLEPGSVYVVEFWATWCGPCRVSIPHLTEVAKKFESKARIVGVSVWEREKDDDARVKKIDEFVKNMGEKMDYSVAADTTDAFMADNWMKAAGENGIPTAFIVGQDGKIAWIGHPMSELDTVLAKVVEGSYDSRAAAEKRAKAKEQQEAQQKVMKEIADLRKDGKFKEALAALDKAVADEPGLATQTIFYRYNLLLDADEPAAYKYARELADGDYKSNANALAALATAITERNVKLKQPDYVLALALARRANELSKGKNIAHLAGVGEVYYRDHQYDKAVSTLEQAIGLIDKDSEAGANQLKYYEARLEKYKKQREKRSEQKANAPTSDAQK
jgi:thiol-disulfide isomerase/thioredoxin